MNFPFARIGLARGNDPYSATTYRVSDDEQPAADPAVQAIACLAVVATLINLDMPVRIEKG
jgi:hypothetical protein